MKPIVRPFALVYPALYEVRVVLNVSYDAQHAWSFSRESDLAQKCMTCLPSMAEQTGNGIEHHKKVTSFVCFFIYIILHSS